MSSVEVPFGDKSNETATLLLAAAEELGLGSSVVTVSGHTFVVPEKVRDTAFPKDEPKPAKKAVAKKAASSDTAK